MGDRAGEGSLIMGRYTAIFMFLGLASCAFAQRGGYGQGNVVAPGGGGARGYGGYNQGNILSPGGAPFPGTVRLPSNPLGSLTGPNPYAGQNFPIGGRAVRQRTVAVPYGIPVWTSGFYGYGPGYDYGTQPGTNVTVVMPQQPTPQVVINQSFVPQTASPQMHDYSNSDLPETAADNSGVRIYEAPTNGRAEEPPVRTRAAAPAPATRVPASTRDDKPSVYLIALKDSTVRAAIGYWSENGLLKYVTPQGVINHVSLDMLDPVTTVTLNKQQGLDWELQAK